MRVSWNSIGYVLPKSSNSLRLKIFVRMPFTATLLPPVIEDISLAAGKSKRKLRFDWSYHAVYREFSPFRPSSPYYCDIDYNYSLIEVAPIAQLDRALVFGKSGWEFESLWADSLI